MDIKLYYIEGISSIDTPYFATNGSQATISKQEQYFSNHIIQTISTAFYPPHYENVIRFDTSDVDIDSNVNYLSLDYNDKTYYYFIDNITYVSEGIIELYIIMDVIQTYMFDITISSGVIERKFINRWYQENGIWKINRNYIRENVCNNLYYQQEFEILNSKTHLWTFVRKSVGDSTAVTYSHKSNFTTIFKMYNYNDDSSYTQAPVTLDVNQEYSPFAYAFFPYGMSLYNIGGTYTNVGSDINAPEYAHNNYTVDIYLCPFDLTFEYYNHSNGQLSLSRNGGWSTSTLTLASLGTNEPYCIIPTCINNYMSYVIRTYKHYKEIELMLLNRNTSLINDFNINTVPALIDSNYIKLTFGSYACNTTYPIEYLDNNNIFLNYFFTPSNGYRCYYINEDGSMLDKYRTIAVDNNVISYDLKNNHWQEYISNNKARWAQATLKTAIGVGVTVATKNVQLGLIASEIGGVAGSELTPKRQTLSKKGQRKISALKRESTMIETERDVSIASTIASNIGGQALSDYNNYYVPDTVKQNGTYSDIYTNAATIFYSIEYANNIEYCGYYYHKNGYLVNEHIYQNTNIFEYVQNRFYYNVIKMVDSEVHLNNVIEDNYTVNLIKQRLNQGLRLWNINNVYPTSTGYSQVSIGLFKYDNVEYDFI